MIACISLVMRARTNDRTSAFSSIHELLCDTSNEFVESRIEGKPVLNSADHVVGMGDFLAIGQP